jgi:subtilisin-like proprotein convertase family protein
LTVNDNVNYDGYANSRFVIATTALDQFGKQAFYAEPGAPILVSTYGGGVTPGITTTDLRGIAGDDDTDYYNDFGGTSATAPMVSGVVALMLQANPNLSWRDVKHILVDTARKNDPTDPGWTLNGAQHWVNHKYGLGSVDAAAAVQAALTWTNVGPEVVASTGPIQVNQTIPDNNTTGLTSSVFVDRLMKVETVEVVFDATHAFRGDLRVVLTSPDGTQSVLAEKHNDDGDNYNQWTFTSNRHWDEIAKGTWTLKVTDERGNNVGTWNSWRLNIYGTNVTSEHYVTLAANATVSGKNFGVRPLPGARVQFTGFDEETAPHRLTFVFDRDVGQSITADDLEVRNQTTGQVLPASVTRVDYNAGSRTATWTFPGLARGLLADGNYTVRLKAQQVTIAGGGMLDGNGDGVGGDDFTAGFFQLKGDANHDRKVNDGDLAIFFANVGRPGEFEQGDFNYDNRVDFRDFQILELAYGNTLPGPVEASEASAAAFASAPKAVVPAKPAPVKPVPVTPPVKPPVVKATAVAPPVFGTRPIRRNSTDLLRSAPKLFA